ncbi:hypothetical protein B0H21DRAFT_103839 [Amylocystis lapponica]|nr:hypothetical protein B0H21DRAFT_103839 [Amylocystis lapponica]
MSVAVRSPDDNSPIVFDLEQFMGTWHVTHSTLPLWKSKKDVSITYALKNPSSQGTTQFDDIVEYRSESAPSTSKRSRIVGVDTFLPFVSDDPQATQSPPPRYHWRGRGLLCIVTSRWQVLGCSTDTSSGPAWVSPTLKRRCSPLQEIINKAQALGGMVGQLTNDFFAVKRSPPLDG